MVADPLPKKLYDILACPVCKGDVAYTKSKEALSCQACNVKYPIRDGIPVMLPQK